MSRRKQLSTAKGTNNQQRQERRAARNYKLFRELINWFIPPGELFHDRMCDQFQRLAEDVGGERFRTRGWVLIGFDGSRITAPRTESNERAFCAPNYGKGKEAKYGKKKSKGMRRTRNKQNPPQPPKPQAWVTMMWHMGLRLPWGWRLGPSNSSERDHVKDMLRQEYFPENTLFCGDAGFVGYPLWSAILATPQQHFLVRVGANVDLLSQQADIKECGGGEVLCWPKDRMKSGEPPLRLRLVQVTVGKTKMWMLTSVLSERTLPKKQIVKFYKMQWGVEVEFRGLTVCDRVFFAGANAEQKNGRLASVAKQSSHRPPHLMNMHSCAFVKPDAFYDRSSHKPSQFCEEI